MKDPEPNGRGLVFPPLLPWAGLLLALAARALAAGDQTPPRSAPQKPPDFAGDLGPAEINVSGYPERMQKIYRDNFQENCAVRHSPARALNSEFVELNDSELAELKRARPELLADAAVLRADKDIWKRYIKKMKMRPPCCGVCPVMTHEESKEIWEFLVYDSKVRKTGESAEEWQKHRRALLHRFAEHSGKGDSLP